MTQNIYLQSPTGEQIPIPVGEATAGRQQDNRLVISGTGVSRQHATFNRQASQLWITDLKSANGTYINGTQLAPHQPQLLQEGDTIGFGRQITFTVHGLAAGGYQATVIEDGPLYQPQPGFSPPPAPGEAPCPHCGVPNPIGAKFCGGCGQDVTQLDWLTKVKTNPALMVALIVPVILLLGGLLVIGLYFTTANTGLTATLFANNRGLSSWLTVTTMEDEDLYTLYTLNPLTGETHRLAESESQGYRGIAFVSLDYIVRYENIGVSNYYGLEGFGNVGYVLPNDQQVVYRFVNDGSWGLAVADIDGKNSSTLVHEAHYLFSIVDPSDDMITVVVHDEDERASGYLFSLSNGQRLATLFQDTDGGTAYPLPYSRQIFFSTLIDKERTHYIVNSDGSGPVVTYRMEQEEEYYGNVEFLPNGTQYLYANPKGLYVINFDGSGQRELRRGQIDMITGSPDGSYVLARQLIEDDETVNFYLINISDGNAVDITRGVRFASGIFVGDDKILYQEVENDEGDLVLYNIETAESTKLVRSVVYLNVICSDTLRYCAYVRQRESGSNLQLDIVDTQEGTVIDVPRGNRDRVFVRDITDDQIVFTTSEEDEADAYLYLYNFLAEAEPVVLDDQAKSYPDALILSGGNKVFFKAVFGETNAAVYRIDADGSNRKLLLDNVAVHLLEDRKDSILAK